MKAKALSIWISMLKSAQYIICIICIICIRQPDMKFWMQGNFELKTKGFQICYVCKREFLLKTNIFLCVKILGILHICMILKTINPCDWIRFEQRRPFPVENTHLPFFSQQYFSKISEIYQQYISDISAIFQQCWFNTF